MIISGKSGWVGEQVTRLIRLRYAFLEPSR
jgi:hypothetical protein